MKILLLGGLMMIQNAQSAVWLGWATLVVKKDKISEFKTAVNKIIAPTRLEAGCISYSGYQVLDEKGRETSVFKFHEVWKSKEAMMIDHKENSPHMKNFFKEIKAVTKDTYLESFEVGGNLVNQL